MSKQNDLIQNPLKNSDFHGVLDVRAEDLHAVLNKVVLIDVRQPDEFTGELGHIDHARLIPLAGLPEQIDQLSPDQTIVFVCRSGGRSARATAFALEYGLTAVYNLKGGMLRWNQLGFEVKK
jgi:rhodanese-related sulfurtransferase